MWKQTQAFLVKGLIQTRKVRFENILLDLLPTSKRVVQVISYNNY